MMIIFILFFVLIYAASDLYIYRRNRWFLGANKWIRNTYVFQSVITIIIVLFAGFFLKAQYNTPDQEHVLLGMWGVYLFYLLLVVKCTYVLISSLDLLVQRFLCTKKTVQKTDFRVFNKIAIVVAAFAAAVMIYSADRGRNEIRVEHVTISSDKIPKAFNGYKIAVFSDVHLGNLSRKSGLVERMVDTINKYSPDMIVNGGDLVNIHAKELTDDDIDQLSKLNSKDGVFSVLGNHDLGFYLPEKKPFITPAESVNELTVKQANLGWNLLRNQSRNIVRGGDTITVSGVDYTMEKRHLKHDTGLGHSDLAATYAGVSPEKFNVLVSHTPDIWNDVVNQKRADLTVAGHTHAMQMKLSLFGKVFSPAKFMYQYWGGLYSREERHLYVNDGIGYVMYPLRIGTKPEITIITLKKP